MNAEQVTEMLKEVGPRVGALQLECAENDGSWAFFFKEGPMCMLEHCEGRDWFVLSSELGVLGDADRIGLYELMLSYNDQGATTGGARLGIDDADGMATLSVDLSADDLQPNQFCSLIEGFRGLRSVWSQIVEGWPAAANADAPTKDFMSKLRA